MFQPIIKSDKGALDYSPVLIISVLSIINSMVIAAICHTTISVLFVFRLTLSCYPMRGIRFLFMAVPLT